MTGRGNRRIMIRAGRLSDDRVWYSTVWLWREDGDGRTHWRWIECSAAGPGHLISKSTLLGFTLYKNSRNRFQGWRRHVFCCCIHRVDSEGETYLKRIIMGKSRAG